MSTRAFIGFRIALGLAGFLLLGAGAFVALQGEAAAAGAVFAAAIVCLIFAFLPAFKRFKAFGVEAELKAKIEEADELLARLRGVMVPFSEMLLSTTARMGRWSSGMPRDKKLELIRQIEAELIQCGVTSAQLERAKADWHFFNVFDLSGPAIQRISDVLHRKLNERNAEMNSVPQPIRPEMMERFNSLHARAGVAHAAIEELNAMQQQAADPMLATRLRAFVTDSSLLEESEKSVLLTSIRDELDDVQHYIDHKEFRRLSVWLAEK